MFWVCRFTKRKTLLTIFIFAVYYLILCHIISFVTSNIWIVSKKECVGHSVFTVKTLPRSLDWEVFLRSLDKCLCNFPIGFLYHKWVWVTLEDMARLGPAGRWALLWSTELQCLRPALSRWGVPGWRTCSPAKPRERPWWIVSECFQLYLWLLGLSGEHTALETSEGIKEVWAVIYLRHAQWLRPQGQAGWGTAEARDLSALTGLCLLEHSVHWALSEKHWKASAKTWRTNLVFWYLRLCFIFWF